MPALATSISVQTRQLVPLHHISSFILWGFCRGAAKASRPVANSAHPRPFSPRVSLAQLVHFTMSQVSHSVRRAIDPLVRDPLVRPSSKLSVGLLTLRTGNRISVPSCVWFLDALNLPLHHPAHTTQYCIIATKTIGVSALAAPITGCGWGEARIS